MSPRFAFRPVACAALLFAAASAAHATNGYLPHGFGLKAKGMGGASVALAQDGFAGVNNPAAAAFAGNRWDIGAEIFRPERGVSGFTPSEVVSDRGTFLIPEFGYNVKVSDRIGFGLTVYGNGGMNTTYPTNVFQGPGKLGVDLMQLIVAPTLAYTVSEGHSVGVSPLLVLQRFEAYGLEPFQGFSTQPDAMTTNGKDTSKGVGVRLGYMGRLNDQVTVGASYSPKINMSRFDRYAGLFAGAGDFDIPENYALGVAVQVTPSVQVALDYHKTMYSDVPAVGNPSMANIANGMGAPNGPGFGWQDVGVVKLGVQWQVNQNWTLRAGYNHGDNPVRAEDVMLNVLAPGVPQTHFTLGGTYQPNPSEEWTFAFWHAKDNVVSGNAYDFSDYPNSVTPFPVSVHMKQNGIGLQYSRKF